MNGYAVTASAKYEEESDYAESSSRKKKVKKAGFFKKWMLSALKDAVEQERADKQEIESMQQVKTSRNTIGIGPIGVTPSIDQPDRAIQFTVYVANGGRVVETRRYDRQKDRSLNGLYVITNDQDFGKEIDKIIVMEGLK
jgi:CRISPR/Cas system CSM-associated protein Csm4 (group 5 of RAMP superfamily)